MFMGRFEIPDFFLRIAGKTKTIEDTETGHRIEVESDTPFFDKTDGSYYLKVNPKLAPILDSESGPEGLIFPMDFETATGVTIEGEPVPVRTEIPTRMFGLVRDPILRYYKSNPELYGVSVDVALSAGLLRVKVQWWKTIVFCVFCFAMGYLVH